MPLALVILLFALAGFGVLAQISPCNPGQARFFGRDLADNVLYWLVELLFFGDLTTLYIKVGAGALFGAAGPAAAAAALAGYGPASRLPLLLQAGLVLVALDFAQYWLHRLFHAGWLWPFHAIHHSVQDLDWSAAYRFHPVNLAIYVSGALALIHLVGFSAAAFLIVGPINFVASLVVHANLDWTFGPFRFVVASPVFHRWHHVKDPAVLNRNFAPNFPIWDLLFGTYYMPEGRLPGDYGVEGVPPHFIGQLVYPFRILAQRLGPARPRGQAAAPSA